MSLPALLKAAAFDGSTLTATIGDDWLQGRTAYGGLSTAIALAATKQAFADLPPLRSAQIAFAGPLADLVSARPQLLRRGKNSAFVRCDVSGGDGTGLSALFLFMTPRPSVIDHPAPPMPEVAGPDAKPADVNGKSPGFLHNFDIALETNPADGYLRWARLKDRSALDPEVEFMAIADALPPAAMALSPTWGPISTTTWQVNLLTDAVSSPDGWWLLEARTLHAGNGSSSQSMTIWNSAGLAVATATQSVALFV